MLCNEICVEINLIKSPLPRLAADHPQVRPPTHAVYCAPPYWQTEGYGVQFGFDHYERMAEVAATIKGQMIISINDHPDIRAVFSKLQVIEIDYQYTVGGKGKPTDCVELVFGNWKEKPKARGQQGLF
jgi:DNA adenine methylase